MVSSPNFLTSVSSEKINARFGTDGIRGRVDSVLIPTLSLQIRYWLGRVLVRASGTEPLLMVIVEGSDKKTVESLSTQLTALAKDHLQEA